MAGSEGGTEDAADNRDDDRVGSAIGKYTLARVIGRGGMGIVYEALNTAIGKRVAIKLVSVELSKNKDAVRRFHREAQAASAVESAHIGGVVGSAIYAGEAIAEMMPWLRLAEALGVGKHATFGNGRISVEVLG